MEILLFIILILFSLILSTVMFIHYKNYKNDKTIKDENKSFFEFKIILAAGFLFMMSVVLTIILLFKTC